MARLPAIRPASGYKMLQESRGCLKGGLLPQIRAPARLRCGMESRLMYGFVVLRAFSAPIFSRLSCFLALTPDLAPSHRAL